VNAGFQAPAFSSSASGTNPAFTNQGGSFQVSGNGDAQFQNVTVTKAFYTSVTGAAAAVQQLNNNFVITGSGNAGFQSTALYLQSSPFTGAGGGVGSGSALLSATTAGLYLSVNGAPPALLATGGAPGAPPNSIQFNNSGAFGGSSNFIWNNTTSTATITGTATSGFQAPAFSSSNAGTNTAFTTQGGTFSILGNGTASFQSIALTNGITVGNGFYGITTAGALTVSSCSGCGAGVTSWNTRTGAVTLTKTDVTNVEGQGLGTGDAVTHASITAGTHNSTSTGATAAFTQQSGQFQINGDGRAFFQSVCAISGSPSGETCNGSSIATGTIMGSGLIAATSGASIRNNGSNYGISETDSGGGCNIGTLYAGGIGCSSDARLKKNVRGLQDSLAKVLELRPVGFQWTKNDAIGVGFIAQDVEKLFPDIVHRGDDGYLLLDQAGLIAPLVQAVQQLAARVAALEARR
jgi:hypothetical protein